MKRLVTATFVVVVFSTVHAQLTDPVILTGTVGTIIAGPALETDPHISGSRVTYTSVLGVGMGRVSRIHVFNLLTGERTVLAEGADDIDTAADISGDYVVFRRQSPTSATEGIYFVDLSDPLMTIRELAPEAGERRAHPAVEGTTVAFEQAVDNFIYTNICVASLAEPDAAAQCVTDDTNLFNNQPALGPDGNTLVFQKCIFQSGPCDIYASRRINGLWTTPDPITLGGGDDRLPKTDGNLVVYCSNATGDFDVYYEPLTGTGTATRLELTDALGGHELAPKIAGNLITFERSAGPIIGENTELYAVDLTTNALFRLPPTTHVNERFHDVAVNPDGTVHFVWAAIDPATPDYGYNVYSFSFNPANASFAVCPLFDVSKSFKAGRVAPLRIQLCDANGGNLSRPDLVLTAVELVHHDATASAVLAPDSPGEANADGVFRYDATLDGYVFNLSTHGLSSGTWELRFRVSGQTALSGIRFDIR